MIKWIQSKWIKNMFLNFNRKIGITLFALSRISTKDLALSIFPLKCLESKDVLMLQVLWTFQLKSSAWLVDCRISWLLVQQQQKTEKKAHAIDAVEPISWRNIHVPDTDRIEWMFKSWSRIIRP